MLPQCCQRSGLVHDLFIASFATGYLQMVLRFPQDPMLVKSVKTLPTGDALRGGCVYEPKFDGYRGLLFITDDGCRVQSRRGHDITAAFSDVAQVAADALPAGVILDGELVVWGSGALDFGELQRRLAAGRSRKSVKSRPPASFVAFDVLEAAGTDLRSQPLHVRRAALEMLLDDARPPLQLVPQTVDVDEAREWLTQYTDNPVGIEGVVVKGRSTRYAPGKREWLKVRIRDTVEAIVAGVIGPLSAPERLILARFGEGGGLDFAGTTTELNTRQRAEIGQLLEEPTDEDPHPWPIEDAQRGVGRWGSTDRTPFLLVRPSLVVEISADTAIDGLRWRHATTFVRTRPDLAPAET